uniref:putative serine/threonine-protein kinase receptor n=1 Tax=Erigeron canadensis TaxID=72917 RepID=UPI001CB89E2A|nr:putative serine/threonine-protein kinase receptor [Erigeron canadensis]
MASTIITTLKHLQIPLEEVVKATNNFDEDNVIGGGDFGKVYRGQLSVSGEMVNIAARRLDPKHRGGGVEFWTEISVLSSLKHENILSLIGFCDENGEKIIINKDEATKGSLSMYLSDPTTLTWIQRLNICVGVARALRYIHNGEGRGYSVIHRNINSSTILLDDNWEAKLSGFEYSIKQSVTRMDLVVLSEAIGTTGYMDPSIVKTGGVSQKSDIFSFGVVLCEILCGRKAFIPDVGVDDRLLAPLFVSHYDKRSLNDIMLPDHMTEASLIGFSNAAYSCLKEDRAQRPKMNDIVIELQKALEFQQQLEYMRKNLGPLKIPFRTIMLATKNFSGAYYIGCNNYCTAYFMDIEIPSDMSRRNRVLTKRYLPGEDGVGEELFFTDMKVLNICNHPNIAKLHGFCVEGSERILILKNYNYGLDSYLSNDFLRSKFTWGKRLKVCLDVANALNYIHNDMKDQMTIINMCIASDNIVVDNREAKIGNFCEAVILPPNQDETFHMYCVGNPYYMDPEYKHSGKLKKESDVYCFGVVLFEVLCGRLANDPIYLKKGEQGLAIMGRRCFQEGTLLIEMIDPTLKEEGVENNSTIKRGVNKDSVEKFIKIAHQCIAKTQNQRPTMKVVVKELEEALFLQVTL